MNAAAYRSVIVSYRGGSPIRLEEFGQVIDGIEDDKAASWFYKDGKSKRAVVLAIQRQPGTNTREAMEENLTRESRQAHALLDMLSAEQLSAVCSLLEVMVEPLARS